MNESNYIFIGSYIPIEETHKHQNFSLAGIILQEKLIKMLKPQLIVSLIPIFYRSEADFNKNSNCFYVHNYLAFPFFLAKPYKMLRDTLQALKLLITYHDYTYVVYNIDKHNALLVFLLKHVYGRKIIVLVADYAKYKNRFVNTLVKRTLKQVHANIVLNSSIKLNPNTYVMNGLLYAESIRKPKKQSLRKRVLLIGSLGETTGLNFALNFFENNDDYELNLVGSPFRQSQKEFDSLVNRYTSQNDNIIYWGNLTPDSTKLLEIIDRCDIGLSLRNPSHVEHIYNFPSKILFYMSNSLLVISTVKYIDIPDNLLFYIDYNENSFKKILDRIFEFDEIEILNKRFAIFKYLSENFTEKNFIKLLNNIA